MCRLQCLHCVSTRPTSWPKWCTSSAGNINLKIWTLLPMSWGTSVVTHIEPLVSKQYTTSPCWLSESKDGAGLSRKSTVSPWGCCTTQKKQEKKTKFEQIANWKEGKQMTNLKKTNQDRSINALVSFYIDRFSMLILTSSSEIPSSWLSWLQNSLKLAETTIKQKNFRSYLLLFFFFFFEACTLRQSS